MGLDGKCLGHGGSTMLMNGLMSLCQDWVRYHRSGFITRGQVQYLFLFLYHSLTFHHRMIQQKKALIRCQHLLLNFLASRTVRNKFLFIIKYPASDTMLQQQKTDEDTPIMAFTILREAGSLFKESTN